MPGLQLPNPTPTNQAVHNVMRANRARNTGPELRMRKALRDAGLSGYRLHWKGVPGHPDIAYPGRRLAIFVQGCYWHHCPGCYPNLPKSNQAFWARKFELNRERDARKRANLEAVGWTVIEVWECELKEHQPAVVARIRAGLTARPSRFEEPQKPRRTNDNPARSAPLRPAFPRTDGPQRTSRLGPIR